MRVHIFVRSATRHRHRGRRGRRRRRRRRRCRSFTILQNGYL